MESSLSPKKRPSRDGSVAPLSESEISALLSGLALWERRGSTIRKTFLFDNFYQTMAFVNLVAWISHQENHHPDMKVGYRQCLVEYTTHSLGGLSENDFICAAKIDAHLT